MKKLFLLLVFVGAGYFIFTAQNTPDRSVNQSTVEIPPIMNYMVLNNWCIAHGVTPPDYVTSNIEARMNSQIVPNPYVPAPQIQPNLVDPGPDVPMSPNLFQAFENSIKINEANPLQALLDANARIQGSPVYVLQSWWFTTNGGANWFGSEDTPPSIGTNSYGDPVAAWTKTGGRAFYQCIGRLGGLPTTSTTDFGVTWSTAVSADPNTSTGDDKNHAMTDLSGVYPNNVYCLWTDFGVGGGPPAQFTRSTNLGTSWNPRITLAIGSTRGQGTKITTGPNGEVYCTWAVYNPSGSPSETNIGFAKSTDGGASFAAIGPTSIFPIVGVRNGNSGIPEFGNIRCTSFPDIDCDRSNGPRRGWIYILTQEWVSPSVHTSNIRLYKSTNGGTTWDAGTTVNNTGTQHFFGGIGCDASNGVLSISYYNMDSVGMWTSRWLAMSQDGGVTWDQGKVSDIRFIPQNVNCPNTVGAYMGDYYECAAAGGRTLAEWTDPRTGSGCGNWKAYVQPFVLGPTIQHTPLGNTSQTAGTRAVDCVILPAGSPINPAATKLLYSRNNPVMTDSVLMTNTGGNNWTANITMSGAGLYRYYLKTADMLGRIATSPPGAPGTTHQFIATALVTNCKSTYVPIRDFTTSYDSMFVNANGTITDVNFRMDSLIHTFDGDVSFWVRSPAGTEVSLSAQRGGGGQNYIMTLFNDSAATPISAGSAPFTGSFRPETPLSVFNGQNLLGYWRLRVSDNAASDTGSVRRWCLLIETSGFIVSISSNNNQVPEKFELAQNYPNPFNPSTNIKYAIEKQSMVKLAVYDILGREIKTLVNEFKQPGNYQITFDAENIATGVYFYKLEAGDFVDVKKMVLMK
jgi:subtilisin-like proprotein convertase family protein